MANCFFMNVFSNGYYKDTCNLCNTNYNLVNEGKFCNLNQCKEMQYENGTPTEACQ